MSQQANTSWWEQVRDRNRSLKGYISARTRHSARMDRLQGTQPTRRWYSVPAIARRIGIPLASLKRMLRGQGEASPALLQKLAGDLDIPVRELKQAGASQTGTGRLSLVERGHGSADPFQALEDRLISSARALVEVLRNCAEQGQDAARSVNRRQER